MKVVETGSYAAVVAGIAVLGVQAGLSLQSCTPNPNMRLLVGSQQRKTSRGKVNQDYSFLNVRF